MRRVFLSLVVLVLFGTGACRGRNQDVTFAAAASLKQVLPKLIDACEKKHPGAHFVATYGASGDLEKQVEAGAPIDAVIFASKKPVDELIAKKRVDEETRRVLATNQLVLIAAKPRSGDVATPKLTFETLDALPASERLAIGDPGAVPAGQYAKEALEKLGKWDALKDRLVFGSDVSAVLAYARHGEVPFAIVYETEARGIDDIVVLDRAQGAYAPHPEVVGGVVTHANGSARAKELLDFVASDEGEAILHDFGFGPP